MFDIGFWELVLISVVALLILGPERLPHTIRSVAKFISTAKDMVNNVKDEISQELKIKEQQDNLHKDERIGMKELSSNLQKTVNGLHESVRDVRPPFENKKQELVSSVTEETKP